MEALQTLWDKIYNETIKDQQYVGQYVGPIYHMLVELSESEYKEMADIFNILEGPLKDKNLK